MRILLAGDTHRNLRHTLWLIDQAADLRCASLFVLGDFAYRMDDGGQWFIQEVGDAAVDAGILVHWLDGNHDDHDWLDDVRADDCTDDDGFLASGHVAVRYAPRGHRWTWGGLDFAALGGAHSIDQRHRFPHVSWWPQETITAADVDRCLDGGPLDVLLTHDAPTASPVAAVMAERGRRYTDRPHTEANRRAVEQVRRATTPGVVAHGHYHLRYTRRFADGGTSIGLGHDRQGHDSRVLFDTRHFDPAALRPPVQHDDPQRTGCRDPGRDGVAVPR